MSMRLWSVVGGLVLAIVCGAATARAQDGYAPAQAGPEHELLKHDVGTWDATIKAWMGPGEPTESKGTEVNELLPGGLWLMSRFEGDFGGMTFHGRGANGYDTHKKKYVATWIDSMSTTPMLMEGSYDAKTKTLTMEGESIGPDGKPAKVRNVVVYKDDGTRVFTMSMKSDATGPDWFKSMEVTYTKRKGDAAK